MASNPGFYPDGTPWTFAEGRVCEGLNDERCTAPLPDCATRDGSFSVRCPKHRLAYNRWKNHAQPDRHKTKKKAPRQSANPKRAPMDPKKRGRVAQAWKDALVHAVGTEGTSTAEVLRRLGVTQRALDAQRERDPVFAAKLQAAKLQGRDVTDSPDENLANFGDFARTYFGRSHFAHQLLLADTIDTLEARDVVMVLMPPESGKTATIEDYMCRQLALDPAHRFRVISEAADLSTRIVGTCARRFTDTEQYPDFIARYGPFYEKGQERSHGKPWTSSQLTLWKNPGTERDRSLVAQSWSGANYGSRIDTLIIDDVISQRSVGQSQEILDRIRGTFFNRGISMRVLWVGTRIGPGDVYDLAIDAGLVTRQLIIPAMGGMGKGPGEPTTPEMWEYKLRHNGGSCCPPGIERDCPRNGEWLTPKEFLDLIRFQSGEETWWASYMQNPRDNAVSTFGEALDDCRDMERTIGPVEGGMNVLTIDPALGGGTALTVQNHTATKLSILDAHSVRGLAKTEQQIELIAQFARRYRPSILIVEYDAQQKGLGNDDRLRALGSQLGFSIVPHITRGQKVDVPYAVASMNQSFVKHEISIPWGDDDTRHKMEMLVHQLRGWRIPEQGKRDRQVQDLVMALWFGWKHWMQTRGVRDQKFARAPRPSWIGSLNFKRPAMTGRP